MHGAYMEGEEIGAMLAECVLDGDCPGLEHVDVVLNAQPYDIE